MTMDVFLSRVEFPVITVVGFNPNLTRGMLEPELARRYTCDKVSSVDSIKQFSFQMLVH